MTDQIPTQTKTSTPSSRAENQESNSGSVPATPGGQPSTLSPNLKQNFKQPIVTGLVVAVVGGLLLAFLKVVLPQAWDWLFSPSVPSGAVLAFDREDLTEDTCPAGWRPYVEARARTIVGAGDPTKASGGLASDEKGVLLVGFKFRQGGGEQAHELSLQEVPSHQHKFVDNDFRTHPGQPPADTFGGFNDPRGGFLGSLGDETEPAGGDTANNGRAKPHNTMPPYIALFYCKKI